VKITILVVGRARGPLASAVAEYEERAGRYWKMEVVEVDAGASGGLRDGTLKEEGQRLSARIPDGSAVVALTREGTGTSSDGLARWLGGRGLHGRGDTCFVIGGAYGLADEVLSRAERLLSLSPMTLPHDLARLVLAEQLYRAGTILRGEPYHKGS
jgi:23S rRNA (pseudouridine1915-N3)-methyltransferase